MNFVVDASIALSWCFEDEGGDYAVAVAYLELAVRLGVPVATLDAPLGAAAETEGMGILRP